MMSANDPPHFFRLQRGRFAERLVPVDSEDEAEYVSASYAQRLKDTDRTLLEAASGRARAAQAAMAQGRQEADGLRGQVADLERHLADAHERLRAQEAAHAAERARLVNKREELAREKRHLRDLLAEKHAIPRDSFRIEIDRDDVPEAMRLIALDTMPGEEYRFKALAEARALVKTYPHTARLRRILLTKTLWQAEILVTMKG